MTTKPIPNRHAKGLPHRLQVLSVFAAALATSSASYALNFGPDDMFSLTGFAEVTVGGASNHCLDCQWVAGQEKDKIWSDPLLPGKSYGRVTTAFYQVQPYLGAKYDLGKGYKLGGLLSQRWRDGWVDGKQTETRYGGLVDVPNYWYEKNISVSHEDYGSLRIGSMLTRGGSVADYPYGSNLGLSAAWSASGSGYGMLANAVRYTSRALDVAEGDLVLEATYDMGNTDFKINKPSFLELYAQFHKGDLVIDAMYQDARNGTPGAWAKGPFSGLTPNSADDKLLTGSNQSMAMIMARYHANAKLEVSGGLRRNQWSGANAVQNPATLQWNNMFNVNWGGTLNGVANPGYAASSSDVLLGARYFMGKWVASAGAVHLGTASTANPSERGQSNSALIGSLGLQYDYGSGIKFNLQAGAVHYARLGLSPLSMPGNSSFTEVDSRVTQDGNWFTVGMLYAF